MSRSLIKVGDGFLRVGGQLAVLDDAPIVTPPPVDPPDEPVDPPPPSPDVLTDAQLLAMDWDAETGPTASSTLTVQQTKERYGRATIGDGQEITQTSRVTVVAFQPPTSAGRYAINGLGVNTPVTEADLQVGGTARAAITRSRIAPKYPPKGNSSGSTMQGLGPLEHVDIVAMIDGWLPSGQIAPLPSRRARAYRSRIGGRYPALYLGYPWGGGTAGDPNQTVGRYPTDEEILGSRSFQPGMTVAAGDLVRVNNGGLRMYQAVTSGTAGASASAWTHTTPWMNIAAGSTAQPFASGTAQFVYVGELGHADGVQLSAGGWVDLIEGVSHSFDNSHAFLQAAYSGTYNGAAYPVPIQSVHFRRWTFLKGQKQPNTFIGTGNLGGNTGGTDTAYGKSTPSGLQRDPTSHVWSLNPNAKNSRPWSTVVKGCWFETTFTHGTGGGAINGSGALGARLVFLRTEEDWMRAVAEQFVELDYALHHELLAQMLLGNVIWPDLDLTLDQDVLEARYQAGRVPGACDARAHVVWDTNRRVTVDPTTGALTVGALLHPTGVWAGRSGFDTDGYLIVAS